jgi:putative transposase
VILNAKDPHAVSQSRLSGRAIHTKFKRLCIQAGVLLTRYPLCTEDAGRRAVRKYARALLYKHFSKGARRLGGKNAQTRAHTGTGYPKHPLTSAPFDVCSIDAHRLHFIGVVGIPGVHRTEYIPIHRVQFIPVIEHESTAVLGYHVAITREASALDAVRAVRNALAVSPPRTLSLPGHSYPSGAGMPSFAIPEVAGLCWSSLLVDNASIHYSNAFVERLRRRIGCAVNFGPVGQWYRRPLVEALFSALERRGFLQLPNTTGTHPQDPLRPDAAKEAVKHAMILEEMLDLIDIVTCTYNATPRPSLGDWSPLERLRDAVRNAGSTWFPRRLPPLPPSVPDLDVQVEVRTIRGDLPNGRRPYVTIDGVRYTSPLLSAAASLVGTQLVCHINVDDLRTVKAFFPSGAELGVLLATQTWATTRHDRLLRKQIRHALKERELVVDTDHDVIEEYLGLKARQARQSVAERRNQRPKISDAATALARGVHIAQRTVPTVYDAPLFKPDDSPTESIRSSARTPLPALSSSIVPRIRHRGIVK